MRAARWFLLLAASVFALETFPGCDNDLFKTGEHSEQEAGLSPAGASGQAGRDAGSASGGKTPGGNANGGIGASGAGTGGRNGSGGAVGFDGGASTGGAPADGGSNDSGGAATSGGHSNAGGSIGSGGKASGGTAGAAGSGGRPASGGANTSGGAVSTGGAPNLFPTTAILDDFNRQDLGSNWTGDNTSFGIVSNHLECSYCLVPELWSAQFAEPQEAYLTITTFAPTTKEVNVVMVAQDPACNQIEILYAPVSKEIRIDYCYDGQWKSTASFARTLQPGDRFGGRANIDGTVDIFVNGTAVKRYDLSDFPYKGGHIGVSGDTPEGTSIAVDDFGGGTL